MITKCYWCTSLCLAPQHAVSSQKALEDLPMIRRADLENHNRDGGLWIVVDRKVYDVQDFRYVSPLKKFNLYVLMSSLHCDMVISISTSYSGGSRFEPGILVRNKVFWYFLWLHWVHSSKCCNNYIQSNIIIPSTSFPIHYSLCDEWHILDETDGLWDVGCELHIYDADCLRILSCM